MRLSGSEPSSFFSPVQMVGQELIQTAQVVNLIVVPSSKLTWQWTFTFSNRKYIFKSWIFHCYVSLAEGNGFLKRFRSFVD